ncbi:hypothetical protein BS78_05G088000 [Paspalum vaginatum]|nr:hypothetical protein BS78_05G088000 [Paspalum vaginatum]
MDAAQWHQGGLAKPMEETLVAGNTNPSQNQSPSQPPAAPSDAGAGAGAGAGRRAQRRKEEPLDCPRCNSTNTKFCYYYNYSLTQPCYFCKTCRRYWTEGNSLRNAPAGGGSRKNRRRPSSSLVATSSAATTAASSTTSTASVPSGTVHSGLRAENHDDLNMSFQALLGLGLESSSVCSPGGTAAGAADRGLGALSALEMVRGVGCDIPLPDLHLGMPGDHAALPLQPQPQSMLGLSLGTHAAGEVSGARLQGVQLQESAAGRPLFPFQDLRPTVSAAGDASVGMLSLSPSTTKMNDGIAMSETSGLY